MLGNPDDFVVVKAKHGGNPILVDHVRNESRAMRAYTQYSIRMHQIP